MPIVDENQGGLRRYMVMSMVENPDLYNANSYAITNYGSCPLTSCQEATSRLKYTRFLHMKRLRTVEREVAYPFADMTFFSSYQSVNDVHRLVTVDDCTNIYDQKVKLQKACYEELQLVDPKRDMIQTPIDSDDPMIAKIIAAGNATAVNDTNDRHHRGYILVAYNTMEDMYNRTFVTSWKTWTGVRYICMTLPTQLSLRRISFYRQLGNTSTFTYVLMIEISNLLLYTAHTLNLMDRMRPRLSGYVGIYREVDFTIDRVSAAKLQIDTTVMPANTLERNHSISVNIDERLQRGGDAVVEPSKTGTGVIRLDRIGSLDSICSPPPPPTITTPVPAKLPPIAAEASVSSDDDEPLPMVTSVDDNHRSETKTLVSSIKTTAAPIVELVPPSPSPQPPPTQRDKKKKSKREQRSSSPKHLFESARHFLQRSSTRPTAGQLLVMKQFTHVKVSDVSRREPSTNQYKFDGQLTTDNDGSFVDKPPSSQMSQYDNKNEQSTLPHQHQQQQPPPIISPTPMPQYERFVGQGKIYHGRRIEPIVFKPLLLSGVRQELPNRYIGYQKLHPTSVQRSCDISERPPPPPQQQQQFHRYESVFTRRDPVPPPQDFSTIAANVYNSPIFSRSEWTQQSTIDPSESSRQSRYVRETDIINSPPINTKGATSTQHTVIDFSGLLPYESANALNNNLTKNTRTASMSSMHHVGSTDHLPLGIRLHRQRQSLAISQEDLIREQMEAASAGGAPLSLSQRMRTRAASFCGDSAEILPRNAPRPPELAAPPNEPPLPPAAPTRQLVLPPPPRRKKSSRNISHRTTSPVEPRRGSRIIAP